MTSKENGLVTNTTSSTLEVNIDGNPYTIHIPETVYLNDEIIKREDLMKSIKNRKVISITTKSELIRGGERVYKDSYPSVSIETEDKPQDTGTLKGVDKDKIICNENTIPSIKSTLERINHKSSYKEEDWIIEGEASHSEKLADEHWEYVGGICEKMYKDAFIHGHKHGEDSK